jgi:putative addiction module CopG family antidote
MTLQLPSDLEALVQRHIAAGGYRDAEEVVRRALEVLEAEENWTEEDRRALDAKIDRALDQVATGRAYTVDEARQRLADLRKRHRASLGG